MDRILKEEHQTENYINRSTELHYRSSYNNDKHALSCLFVKPPAPELNFRIFEIFMAGSQKATLVFHQTQPKGKRDGNQIPCKRRSKILPYLCCLSLLTLPGH
jgi:hypothetical protein